MGKNEKRPRVEVTAGDRWHEGWNWGWGITADVEAFQLRQETSRTRQERNFWEETPKQQADTEKEAQGSPYERKMEKKGVAQ